MNVLIVDDQVSSRIMLRQMIAGLDLAIRVEDFGDSIEAFDWSERNEVDLLLLDYRMPNLDGIEFARRFRSLPDRREVPIILVSAIGDEPIRHAAFEAGVIDFLVKPVRPRELKARCRNLLALRKTGTSLKVKTQNLERQLLAQLNEIDSRERETLFLLARTAEYRDDATGLHLIRMARYAGLIADRLGLSEEDVRTIELAAPLHDIGKISIPDSILLKPGPLNAEELAIMKRHPQIGYELLSVGSSKFVKMAAEIALSHHERFDGLGYPNQLKGNSIPLAARIVTLADVLDAMLSKRPYKEAIPMNTTMDYILQQRGKMFDPACVDALVGVSDLIADVALAFADSLGDTKH